MTRLKAVRQLRLINHPELRKGTRAWGSTGEESRSQEDKKSRCLAIRSLPHYVDFFQIKKKLSLVIALLLMQPSIQILSDI